jgi:hypothetical protein
VALDYPAETIQVGLGYTSRLRTLPIEMARQAGSSASYLKSWNKIFVRLLGSARPMINGVRPPVRNEETVMGLREPNRTEDVSVASLGWDLYGSITIEQDIPLPFTVLGIFGELDQENI